MRLKNFFINNKVTEIIILIFIGIWFWISQARFGFNPTDDGFVLAQSWRILNGEIPHTDFELTRPAGAALLHMPEVLLPWGTIAFSRLLVTFQIIWYSFAFVEILLKSLKQSFKIEYKLMLVFISFLINVNTWPIMAWHTIDGIFIGSTVFWLFFVKIDDDTKKSSIYIALWLLAGFNPLIKQGYLLIPLALLFLTILYKKWKLLYFSPLSILPFILYLIWTKDVPGGWSQQIYGGSFNELINPIVQMGKILNSTLGLIYVFIIILIFILSFFSNKIYKYISLIIIIILLFIQSFREIFNMGGNWTMHFFTISLMIGVFAFIKSFKNIFYLLPVWILSYASAMSWGVPKPSLMAGSLFISILFCIIWLFGSVKNSTLELYQPVILILTFVILISTSLSRNAWIYRDLPRNQLKSEVSIPTLKFIKISEQSKLFIQNLSTCIDKSNSKNFSIIPDGAAFYPIFRVKNLFSVDWWLPNERSRNHDFFISRSIENINSESDWLVLFQSYDLSILPGISPDTINSPSSIISFDSNDLLILEKINGGEISCGSLRGKIKN